MPPLTQAETETLKDAFNTGGGAGYVLDFSDRTMREYLQEEFRLDLDQPKYCVTGTSKGKRLLTFLTVEDANATARVLHSLWERRTRVLAERRETDSAELYNRYFAIVSRLQGYAHIAAAPSSTVTPAPSGAPYKPPQPAGWPSENQQQVRPPTPEPPPPSPKDLLKQSFMSLIPFRRRCAASPSKSFLPSCLRYMA